MRQKALFPLILLWLAQLAGLVFAGSPAWGGTGVLTPVAPGKGGLGRVAVHPASPGKVWLGLPARGLDRSDDRGGSWTWAGRGLGGWAVEAVTADPSRPGALWAATTKAVFHSDDGGAHWQRITGESYPEAIGDVSLRALAVFDGTLYVDTYPGVWASRDGGQTWESTFDAGDNHSVVAFAAGAAGLFVAHAGLPGVELVRSRDGGSSWEYVPGDWSGVEGISQIEVTPTAVYVTVAREGESRLLRSEDGGETWRRILTGPTGGRFSVGPLAVDARQPRTLWALAGAWLPEPLGYYESRLWVSRDGGTTWRARGKASWGSQLTVEPGTEVVYASSFESVWRTRDGGRGGWKVLLNRMDEENPPSQIAFDPANPARLAVVVGNRLMLSQDGARSWSMPDPEARLTDLDIDPANPNRMVGTAGYALVTSADGGRSWTRLPWYFSSYVDQIVRTGRRTLFAGGCGLQRSTDNGLTWQVSLPCGTRYTPRNTGRFLRKLVADPAHPAKLYALTAQVHDFYPNYDTLLDWPSLLWRSEDGGASWQKVEANVQALAMAPSGGQIYILRGRDLLGSRDGGRSWGAVARLPKDAYDLMVPPGDPDAFYALTAWEVLYSGSGGTWAEYRHNLDPGYYAVQRLSALVPHPTDPRTVFVTSHGVVFHLRVP
jgi:photosystem II stability/assembly factor-like uncharacterized protein